MTLGLYLLITFEFWSAVFCIITALCVYLTRKYDYKSAGYLIEVLCLNAFLNVADAMAYYFRGDTTEFGYMMVRASNFAVFACNHFLLLFVLHYICRVVTRNTGKSHKKLRHTAELVIAAGIALLFLSRILGFYYAFDQSNQYYRLPSFWILCLLPEIPLLIAARIIFSEWSYLKRTERNAFLLFIFIPIAGVVVQFFVYGVPISTITNTIAIFTMFFSYEMGYSEYVISKEHRLLDQMTTAFAHAIDEKDKYTGSHSERVAKYSLMIAERMKLDSKSRERLYQMAMLHDVGKIGIDDAILRKPAALSEEEYRTIRTHTEKGSEILLDITEMPELSYGARWHHERYDGKGYPDGLSGEAIPLEARIICVADSYDAMTSNRIYRKFMSQEEVRREIERNIGLQFDPEAAKCMLQIIDDDAGYTLCDFKAESTS